MAAEVKATATVTMDDGNQFRVDSELNREEWLAKLNTDKVSQWIFLNGIDALYALSRDRVRFIAIKESTK